VPVGNWFAFSFGFITTAVFCLAFKEIAAKSGAVTRTLCLGKISHSLYEFHRLDSFFETD
jgi:hypothetical protein